MAYGRDTLQTGRKRIGRRSKAPRHETIGAFVLIRPTKDASPTWPKANPTHVLPRAITRRVACAKTGAYLKSFGSRPEAVAR